MRKFQLQIKFDDDSPWENDELFDAKDWQEASHYAGRRQKEYFTIKQFDVQVRAVPIDKVKELV